MKKRFWFLFAFLLGFSLLFSACEGFVESSSSIPSIGTSSVISSDAESSSEEESSVSSSIPDHPNPDKFLYVVGAAANGWINYTPLTLRIDGVFYGEFELKTTQEGFVITNQDNFDGLVFKTSTDTNFTVSKYGTYMIYFTYDVKNTDSSWSKATEKNNAQDGYYKIELIDAIEIPIDDDIIYISGAATDFGWGTYGPVFFDEDKGYFTKIYRLTDNPQGFIITNAQDTQHLVFHDENDNNFKVVYSGDYEIRFTFEDMSSDSEWNLAKGNDGSNAYYQLIPQFEIPDTGNYLYVFGDSTGGWGNPKKMVEVEPGVWSITLDINTSVQGFVVNEKPALGDKTGANLHDENGNNFVVYESGSYTLMVTWNDMSGVDGWKVAKETNDNEKGDAWYKLTPNFEIIEDDFSVLYVVGGSSGGWETYLPFYPDENGIYEITLDLTDSPEGFIISSRQALNGHRFKNHEKKNFVVPTSGNYTFRFSLEDQGYGWFRSVEELNRTPFTCYQIEANFEGSGLPTLVENYTIFYNLFKHPTNNFRLIATLKDINLDDIKDATVKITHITTGSVRTYDFNHTNFKFSYLNEEEKTGTSIEINPNIGRVLAEADLIFEGSITLNDDTVLTYYFGYFYNSLVSQFDLYSAQLVYDETKYSSEQIAAIEAFKAQCLEDMKLPDADFEAIINSFNEFVSEQLTLEDIEVFRTLLESKYNEENYDSETLQTITNKVNELVALFDGSNGETLEAEFNAFLSSILTPAQIQAFKEELEAMVVEDYDEPSLALINAKIDDLVAEFDGSNAQELKDLFGVYLKQFVTPAQREALKELLLNSYDASLYEEQEQNELLAKIDDLLLTFDGYNEDEILDEFITFRNTKRTAYGKHIDRFEALNLDGDNPLELKNVAVGGTVWTNSTSYNQGTPELVNDGSRDTGIFQDSNANPLDDLVVRIDFGAVKSVKAARIYWGTINNYADSFKVEVSLDGVNWDAIYVVNGQTLYSENLFNKICLEESVNARYIQFVGIKRSKIYGYGFREFQVYGEDVVLPRLSAVSGLEYDVNDNVGKTIYVSYTQNADETLTPAWNAVSFIANIYQGEELVKTIANISNPSNTSGGTLSFDIIGLPLGDYTLKLIALGDYVHNSSSLESEGITITVTEMAKLEAPSDVYIENGRIYFMDNNPDLDNVVYNLVFNDGITTITIEDVVFGGKFDTTNLVDSTTYMVKLVALREGYASSSSEEIEFTYEAPTTPSVKMEGKRVYLYGYVYRQSESRLVLKFADDFFGHYRVYGDNGGFQVDYTKCKLYINDIEVPAYTWKKNYGAWIQADALGDLSTFTFAEFKIQMYDLNGNPFYVQFETESATSNEIKFADPLMSSRMSAITSVIAYNYSPTSSTYHFASYSKEDNEAINAILANYLEELFDLELTDTAGKINSLRDATLAQIATFEKLVEVKPQEVVEASTDNGKEKLIDGSTASSNTWEGLKSDNEKPYFVVDLGEVVDLERLLIYCNSASNVPSTYKVLVSEDGETYVEVVSDVWYQSTAGYLDAWINSNARYVKVEFELLGSKVNVQEIYFIGI